MYPPYGYRRNPYHANNVHNYARQPQPQPQPRPQAYFPNQRAQQMQNTHAPGTRPHQPRADPSTNKDPEGALSAHNTARIAKRVPPLKWSESLSQDAQKYAEHLAKINNMQHASNLHDIRQGENLYMSSNPSASFTEAISCWLAEEKDYHGERIGTQKKMIGHYTQCVWNSTTHVGMGKAKSKNGWTFVVARYAPPGNMRGSTPFGGGGAQQNERVAHGTQGGFRGQGMFAGGFGRRPYGYGGFGGFGRWGW